MTSTRDLVSNDRTRFDFRDEIVYLAETKRGLTRSTVEEISAFKEEPDWMLQYRLRAYEHFLKRPMPTWGGDLTRIDFNRIMYYRKPSEREEKSWDDVPEQIKQTFEKLGIPEAERKFLAGVGAQYDSEVVYHSVREELTKIGVVFMGTDQGLKEYPDIFRKYFGTVVPAEDNKFAALNAAVWSGGSFVYVPKGVEVPLPLQAYFRINGENTGQFERTLIVVDEGAKVHYIEGCLPGSELVSLGDMMVAIDTVSPGTSVMNSAGVRAPVQASRRRSYSGPMLKIVPVSVGNAFELTPEHPVWSLRRERVVRGSRRARPVGRWDVDARRIPSTEPEWVPAGELKVGDLICFPVATRQQDHPELSDDLLRFLGYYLAEGSSFHNGRSGVPTVTLSFHIDERDKIDDARRLMSALSGKTAGVFEKPEKHEARVYVYSRELLELSSTYCGRWAAEKRLHPDLMELPPDRQRLLLDTYLLGDGSRHVRTNGRTLVRASTVSRTLAFQLQEILARSGVYAGIQVRPAFRERMADGREISHREQYGLHFEEGSTIHRVWLDASRNCFWVPIRRIESRLYDGFVYNLEMASAPNAYLARGFAVHNCTAPIYATDSLHAAVVEVIALPNSKVRYTTIQNWSNDVYNLVTKRAHAHEYATVEWIDANTGCLTPDTLVARPDGHFPLSAIRQGDEVFGLSPDLASTTSHVTGRHTNAPGPVFEVKVGERAVRATPNHPFLTLREGFDRPRWLPVASLLPGDRLAAAGSGVDDFVPLTAISYAGELPTIDIEVAGTANFIANGVFVHNSQLTMKYPSIYLRGRGASADIISVAVAGKGQHQDTGAKAIHLAPDTKSRIVSKSVSKDGGRATYRGSLKVSPGATNVVASVRCDALMLDDASRSDTYPYIDINEDDTTMTHEATVGKISQDQVFYLMSRGLTENEAQNLIVQGFLEVFTKELPMEYAIEFNRLVKLEMDGALG
jgi:Fe-S cluster assembly protein SufB